MEAIDRADLDSLVDLGLELALLGEVVHQVGSVALVRGDNPYLLRRQPRLDQPVHDPLDDIALLSIEVGRASG